MKQAQEITWKQRALELSDRLGPFATLVALTIFFAVTTEHFFEIRNLLQLGEQTAVLGIVAVGETFVIISAGIDLSVGSLLALSNVTTALLMVRTGSLWAGIVGGIAVGSLVGLLNGFLTSSARMPSFVVTLGTLMVCRGVAKHITGAHTVSGLPQSLHFLSWRFPVGSWHGEKVEISLLLVIMVLVAIAGHFVLKRTRLGRYTYAMGGNMEATRLSGIPVERYQTAVFALCGLLTGLAGVLHTARLTVGSPTTGLWYELRAIAAAVIGGASLMGGEGGIAGTIVGAFIMAVLVNGLNQKGVPEHWQDITIGSIIVVAVYIDYWRRRRRAG